MKAIDKGKKKGFTLIESIVTIVVLSIMAFGVCYILVEGCRVWVTNRNHIELRSDARFALRKLAAEFQQAEIITFDGGAGSFSIAFGYDMLDDGTSCEIRYAPGSPLTDLDRSVISGPAPHTSATICSNTAVGGVRFTYNAPVLLVEMTLTSQGDTVGLRKKIAARCLP